MSNQELFDHKFELIKEHQSARSYSMKWKLDNLNEYKMANSFLNYWPFNKGMLIIHN